LEVQGHDAYLNLILSVSHPSLLTAPGLIINNQTGIINVLTGFEVSGTNVSCHAPHLFWQNAFLIQSTRQSGFQSTL